MKIWFVILVLVLLVGCSSSEKSCSKDTDCVAKTCCHATDAVNAKSGPNCKWMLCTAECVPKTIDCGQGSIKCVSGECKVVLKWWKRKLITLGLAGVLLC